MFADSMRFAAFAYLGEWLEVDEEAHLILRPDNSATEDQRLESLYKFAKSYGVARNFPGRQAERFRPALRLLDRVRNLHDTVATYNSFVSDIKETYDGYKYSAASKFLWIRFRSGVRIYDQNAEAALRHFGHRLGGDEAAWYGRYCNAWQAEYDAHRAKIDDATSFITVKNIGELFGFSNVDTGRIREATEAAWFQERIFDHYLYKKGALLRAAS
jgi:hypothetical protein